MYQLGEVLSIVDHSLNKKKKKKTLHHWRGIVKYIPLIWWYGVHHHQYENGG